MLVDDEIMLGINFRGEIDNYEDLGELYDDLRRVIDDWIVWNVDGDYDSWIDQYD